MPKVGDEIKLTQEYLNRVCASLRGDDPAFFKRNHKIVKIKGHRWGNFHIRCPSTLGDGDGFWRLVETEFRVVSNVKSVCNCTWPYCRKLTSNET
jgi:hypothetical protein